MELYRSASLQSQFRGYDYFNDKKVISFKHLKDSMYIGKVKGSSVTYDVTIDIEHPKKNSHCNCAHAEGTKIVCKHMVALYFAIFPEKAKTLINKGKIKFQKKLFFYNVFKIKNFMDSRVITSKLSFKYKLLSFG